MRPEAAENAVTRPVTLVSCGLIVDRARSRFLLGSRPAGKPYAGWWELPGGKLEAGESPLECLKREFFEELGIRISECAPWVSIENDYPHAYVRLFIYRIFSFEGELIAREGQRFAWFRIGQVPAGIRLLPRVEQMVRWLDLPDVLSASDRDAEAPEIAGMRGAAVEDIDGVREAARVGAQFAVLSRPGNLSWGNPIPVYFRAEGGDELKRAHELGAHGVLLYGAEAGR